MYAPIHVYSQVKTAKKKRKIVSASRWYESINLKFSDGTPGAFPAFCELDSNHYHWDFDHKAMATIAELLLAI